MGTAVVVIGTGRHNFNAVGPKQSEVTYILVKLLYRKSVIGVSFRPVTRWCPRMEYFGAVEMIV